MLFSNQKVYKQIMNKKCVRIVYLQLLPGSYMRDPAIIETIILCFYMMGEPHERVN